MNEHNIDAKQVEIANKEKYDREKALELLKSASALYLAKGKKLQKIDLKKDEWDEEEIMGMMLGRTGLLRAPTLKKGKTVFVGFNPEGYEEIF
ncbi:MAG: hypothetical protein GF307_12975 [candidate division Zixibacteria bacterium]|nr:hypothetical protein [candidate division Zixibacteria bacterium]